MGLKNRGMKLLYFSLAGCLILVHSAGLRAQDKKFQHFTTSEGLSHNTIFDVAQDGDGFMWIATGEGLNRYDSDGFRSYYSDSSSHSILSDEVRSLQVNTKGQLFVGTSEGLCMFDRERSQFIPVLYQGRSLGTVNDLVETRGGSLLVGAETGLFKIPASGEAPERLPMENNLLEIEQDSLGNFWAFKRQRLFYFNEQGRLLKTYYVRPPVGAPEFIPSAISTIYIDERNRLWIGTFRDGPFVLEPHTDRFKPIDLDHSAGSHPMYFVRDIAQDQEGRYWIGTEKGLFVYDESTRGYEQYVQSFDPTVSAINDNAVYKLFRSRENIMWIGTYFGGLNLCEPFRGGFKKIVPGLDARSLKGKALSQMMKGPDGKLWMATEDAGIALFDERQQTFRHILNEPKPDRGPISNNVHALATDQQGQVWSGNFFGGINQIDPHTYGHRNYAHQDGDPHSLVNNFVFSLYADPSGLIWIGTMDGIDCLEKATRRFTHFKPEALKGKFIYDIFQDEQDRYWFLTNNNFGIYRYDPRLDTLVNYRKENTPGLGCNSFISHWIDSRGKIWLGSRGGGLVLFDPVNGQFKTYDMRDGLPNNVLYGILEDDHNNLWLSSNKGISKFNYITGEIRNFTVDHGLVGNQFNYKSSFRADDGTMYFGAVNGLTYFHPEQIKTYESEPEVHFTSFNLFNQAVVPGEGSILEKDIDLTRHITLKHNQHVIGFDFIALDFHSKGKNNFFYYLDGFESTWQTAGNHQSVTYTNLPPGDYHFRIKATNVYNFPNDLERSIKITVLPPFWKTYWATLIYALVAGAAGYLLYRLNEIRHEEKMTLNIERIEKEKLRELHQHKINFFTYISHEFKTPLTIILASLDAFFSGERLPHEFQNRIITLKRNVGRLQFLINQLMDFRKIETDHALTNLQSGNVIEFLREVFNAFNTLFKRKELEYIFIPECEELFIRFDPDKLEKIVSNLLSNAFKYSPKHGEITFRIGTVREADGQLLKLTISDTGNGMSEEQLAQIFQLFYKGDDPQNDYEGSGIGLTLTQSLVKFLNGSLSVESKLGEGTSFTIQLPYTEAHESKSAAAISLNKSIVDNLLMQSSVEEDDFQEVDGLSEFEILFVEDNKELVKFLCGHFKDKYSVTAASNGVEALKSVRKKIPDLVITDLMMPQMDGLALCKAMKSDFEYWHVPIIMLTAKSDIETKLESLEVGADIYLPKPFILSELELQIRNILMAKSNLKKRFIQSGSMDLEQPVRNKDQQFIEKITCFTLANMDNPLFGVSSLTKELKIGRTLLHIKLKQIMDMSATEFINTIRVREARKLLMEEPDLTMAEVAYKVGFNDPNYFSRTFRKIFNVSPSDFKNEKMKEPQGKEEA